MFVSSRFPNPRPLDVASKRLSEDWFNWFRDYQLFSEATGLSREEERIQVSHLLHWIGDDARHKFYAGHSGRSRFDDLREIVCWFEQLCNPPPPPPPPFTFRGWVRQNKERTSMPFPRHAEIANAHPINVAHDLEAVTSRFESLNNIARAPRLSRPIEKFSECALHGEKQVMMGYSSVAWSLPWRIRSGRHPLIWHEECLGARVGLTRVGVG